jgi:hypothetical protein
MATRQRRIFYERLPAPVVNPPNTNRPIIVQYDQPRVSIHREVINQPGIPVPQQPMPIHMDNNQVLSSIDGNQQIFSSVNIVFVRNKRRESFSSLVHMFSPSCLRLHSSRMIHMLHYSLPTVLFVSLNRISLLCKVHSRIRYHHRRMDYH